MTETETPLKRATYEMVVEQFRNYSGDIDSASVENELMEKGYEMDPDQVYFAERLEKAYEGEDEAREAIRIAEWQLERAEDRVVELQMEADRLDEQEQEGNNDG